MALMPVAAVKVNMGRKMIWRRESGDAVPKRPRMAITAPLAPRDPPLWLVNA